jgi:nucleotide-binding universal stress UspA family protein
MGHPKRWTVVIDIDDQHGRVRATAHLHDREADHLVGEGSALLGPVERCDPEIADQLATARALRRLSQCLIEVAKDEFDRAARQQEAAAATYLAPNPGLWAPVPGSSGPAAPGHGTPRFQVQTAGDSEGTAMNATEHSTHTFDEPSVVVGVDGSHIALDAVRWAAAEARLRHLPLRIVHAAPYAAGHDGPAVRRAHDISARAFTVARRTEPDVRSSTRISEQPPVDALLDAAENAHLLVVGMGGGERPQEILIGSVALEVSGCAHCPVTVVRGRLDHADNRPLLVGVDEPTTDKAVLDVAFSEARRHHDRLLVLHARGPRHDEDTEHDQAVHIAAQDHLADQLTPWADRYPDVPIDLQIVHGPPTPALLAAAVRARMVLLGTRARNAPARALFGSTSRQVLRRCTVPVTVVSPHTHLPRETEPGAPAEQATVASSAGLDPHDRSQLW